MTTLVRSPDGGIFITPDEHKQLAQLRALLEPDTEKFEAQMRQDFPELLGPDETIGDKYPEILGDVRLMRFLIGHGHHVQTAFEKCAETLSWRATSGVAKFIPVVDEIIAKQSLDALPHVAEVRKFVPCNMFAGLSHTGDMFSWERSGRVDIRGLVKHVGLERLTEFEVCHIEVKLRMYDQVTRARAEAMASGGRAYASAEAMMCKGVALKDMQGISRYHTMWKPGLDLLRDMSKVLQNNYPEMLRCCFIVNTPFVFNMAWKVAKMWFTKRTHDRLKLFPHGDGWKVALSEYLGSDQLLDDYFKSVDTVSFE